MIPHLQFNLNSESGRESEGDDGILIGLRCISGCNCFELSISSLILVQDCHQRCCLVCLKRHIQGFYPSMDLLSKCISCCPVAHIHHLGKSLRKECQEYLLRTENWICKIIQLFGVWKIGLRQQRFIKIPDRQGNLKQGRYPSQKYEYWGLLSFPG